MGEKYVRLVVPRRDEDSHVEQGLFHAAEALRAAGSLAKPEEELVAETFRWFNRPLRVPERFARSRRPGAHKKAASWFKPSARHFLARLEELAAVLHAHGLPTTRLTTDRPGYVVYEDEYQIVAEVFREKDR